MEENAGGEGMTPGDGCVVGVEAGGQRENPFVTSTGCCDTEKWD